MSVLAIINAAMSGVGIAAIVAAMISGSSERGWANAGRGNAGAAVAMIGWSTCFLSCCLNVVLQVGGY